MSMSENVNLIEVQSMTNLGLDVIGTTMLALRVRFF